MTDLATDETCGPNNSAGYKTNLKGWTCEKDYPHPKQANAISRFQTWALEKHFHVLRIKLQLICLIPPNTSSELQMKVPIVSMGSHDKLT